MNHDFVKEAFEANGWRMTLEPSMGRGYGISLHDRMQANAAKRRIPFLIGWGRTPAEVREVVYQTAFKRREPDPIPEDGQGQIAPWAAFIDDERMIA